MKVSHGARVSPQNKGLCLEGNWFIILCFRLRSHHGSILCTHPQFYSCVCCFCQNSTWREYRFPVKIPRVLLFDQSKPMTLLFSICLGCLYLLVSTLAPVGGKGHHLVSCWTHILKIDLHKNAKCKPSKPWCLPFGEWYFQTMLASGRPTAWHMRLTLLPSLTVTSLEMLVILAGTVERRKQIKINHWSLIKDVSNRTCWSRWSDRWWG